MAVVILGPLNIIIGFLATIPVVIALLLMVNHYRKTKRRYTLIFIVSMLFYAAWLVISHLSYVYVSHSLFQVAGFMAGIAAIFLIFFVDSISRETPDPIKLIAVSIISTLYITSLFIPGLFSLSPAPPPGGVILELNELYVIAYFLMVTFPSIVILYFFTKLLIKAPRNIKSHAFICYLGVLVGYPLSGVLATLTSLKIIIPGISVMCVVLGNLLMAITFAVQPKLAFVLPFKVLRLTVVQTESGIALFTHTWSRMDDLIDEQLFSSTLQAISSILNESLKSGDIRGIQMDYATLMIHRSYKFPVAFVLVATRFARSLRSALYSFSDRFLSELSPYVTNHHASEKFAPASQYLEDYFQFVPEYLSS